MGELCALLTPTPPIPAPTTPSAPPDKETYEAALSRSCSPVAIPSPRANSQGRGWRGRQLSQPLPRPALSPPPPLGAWGSLRDWLLGSSRPFGGIPWQAKKWWLGGVQDRKPGLSGGPLLCLASVAERQREDIAPRVGLEAHPSPAPSRSGPLAVWPRAGCWGETFSCSKYE